MRPPSVGIYGYLVGGETDKPSKRVKFSRIETRPHRATGAAEAARVVGLRVYKQALERQVQRHLDEPRTAERILDEAASEGSRLIAKRGCGRRYSRDCTVPLASVGGAGLEVGAKTRIQADVVNWSVKTWVVEDIEELRVVTQSEALTQLKCLYDTEIKTRLEWSAKWIATLGRECRFREITRGVGRIFVRGRPARRHPVGSRRIDENSEGAR